MSLDRVIAVRNTKTVYRDDDKCVKVFESDFTKADILSEALNHSRVEQTGLNIPKLLEVTTVDGKWSIVTEYVKGKTIARLMDENPNKKDEYMDMLIRLQLEVLSKHATHLDRFKDKLTRRISLSDLSATARWDLYNQLEEMPKQEWLCHGDFNPTNVIIDENGVPYIIDWSQASSGNIAADAAHTYLYFRLREEDDMAAKYLERFCQRSGEDPDQVKKWIAIAAASQSISVNSKQRDFLLTLAENEDFD